MTRPSPNHPSSAPTSRPKIVFLSALAIALLWTNVSCARKAQAAPPAPQDATLRKAGNARNVILGTAADPRHLREAPYSFTLATEFGQLEPENQLKFGPIHPRPGNSPSSY